MAKRSQSHRGTRYLGNLSATDLSAFNGGMAREARSPDQHGRLSFRPFHLFGGTLPGRVTLLSIMDLVLVGLNHKTAPVEVRERIAFAEEHLQPALKRLQRESDLQEGMIVSTCNRVEILAHGLKSQAQIVQSVKDFLYSYHTLKPLFLEDYLYSYLRHDVVRHVFRVTSSLDSMVVGEPQILSQVKQAYAEACQAGSVGTYLKDLIPRAFFVAKR